MRTRDRKSIANVFKKAKELLQVDSVSRFDKEKFICHAIENVRYPISTNQQRALRIISDRLDPHSTVEDWLKYKCKVRESWELSSVKKAAARKMQIQQYRHAWLDRLIVEFSS